MIYTRESRHAFLDLDVIKLKGLKPLTEPMVAEFAHAARLKLDATWGIAGARLQDQQVRLMDMRPGPALLGSVAPSLP